MEKTGEGRKKKKETGNNNRDTANCALTFLVRAMIAREPILAEVAFGLFRRLLPSHWSEHRRCSRNK